jgi:predicted SnoaL-like aldol condensation-catalyzing enzyme
MSVKENKELIRHAYEKLNQGDTDAFFNLCTPGYVEHLTDRNMNLEQSRQFETNWINESINLNATINEMVAEGDKVAVLVTWRWKQKDTGKKIEMTNVNIFRIAKSKFAEVWNVTDIRLAQQLAATD